MHQNQFSSNIGVDDAVELLATATERGRIKRASSWVKESKDPVDMSWFDKNISTPVSDFTRDNVVAPVAGPKADAAGITANLGKHLGWGLAGAGVGGGLGLLSDTFAPPKKRRPLSSMLTGALLGGIGGVGGSAAYTHGGETAKALGIGTDAAPEPKGNFELRTPTARGIRNVAGAGLVGADLAGSSAGIVNSIKGKNPADLMWAFKNEKLPWHLKDNQTFKDILIKANQEGLSGFQKLVNNPEAFISNITNAGAPHMTGPELSAGIKDMSQSGAWPRRLRESRFGGYLGGKQLPGPSILRNIPRAGAYGAGAAGLFGLSKLEDLIAGQAHQRE